MNRDDISHMAREAGFVGFDGDNGSLRRFAALVAAAERKRIESRPWGAGKEWIARAVEAEREACAQVCEENADDDSEGDWDNACNNCAYHIRARGKHE